jgi:D-serine deaminase-like pyridoxal phosphate-dependent protein
MSFMDRIDQPTLILDEATARRNIDRMVVKALRNRVNFRPHFKTHQSAEIGHWFREKGVESITVSSVEMAEYFADNGWQDITIAFSLNIRQLERIRKLAQTIRLQVLVESAEGIRSIANLTDCPLGVWVKIDVGNNRTGLDWQQVDLVKKLCDQVKGSSNLHLLGLLTHSGNTYRARSRAEVCSIFREGIDRLEHLRLALEDQGLNDILISVGDTPGCTLCDDWSSIYEVRPGNFVFYDAQQFIAGVCDYKDIAVALACPVVAKHPLRREVVVYGGAIHLSKDYVEINGQRSYGLAALQEGDCWGALIPGAIVKGLSQEHGIVKIEGPEFEHIKIGDLLFILPAHSCLTVQVMRKYHTLTGRVITTLNQS